MKLLKLDGSYNIAKFDNRFYSNIHNIIDKVFTVVFEDQCLSIIFESKYADIINCISDQIEMDEGWGLFKIDGNIDFSCYGILKSIIYNISEDGISVLVTSSFDTDYIFIKNDSVNKAIKIWEKNDFIIEGLS